jgi:hypothetical protein
VGENIVIIDKSTEALLDNSKEAGLEVNPEKTKCKVMSRYQKAGQKHSIKTARCGKVRIFGNNTNGSKLQDQRD